MRARWRREAALKKKMAKENDLEKYNSMISRKSAYDKMYRQRERAKRKAWNEAYVRRNENNVQFQLTRRIRARIRVAIVKGYGKKATRSMELLGCTIPEVKAHLESLFTPDMSWEAFLKGLIHIDHIRPCSSYDLTDKPQQMLCFNWKNLQPLWKPDNLSKGDKMPCSSFMA